MRWGTLYELRIHTFIVKLKLVLLQLQEVLLQFLSNNIQCFDFVRYFRNLVVYESLEDCQE